MTAEHQHGDINGLDTTKVQAEVAKLIAEAGKLLAEQQKFNAEQAKLYAEASKLTREKILYPLIAAATAASAVLAGGAIVLRLLS
jgi:hypothetical protein